MANRITTRMQKEVGQLQKDLEKMAKKIEQLMIKFHTSIEAMGTEMRNMFEKMMIQMKSTNTTSTVELLEGARGVFFSEMKMKSAMVTGTK